MISWIIVAIQIIVLWKLFSIHRESNRLRRDNYNLADSWARREKNLVKSSIIDGQWFVTYPGGDTEEERMANKSRAHQLLSALINKKGD